MKKQSMVIPIYSYSNFDKENLIESIENRLPMGYFLNAIQILKIDNHRLSLVEVHRKKNLWFKNLCLQRGSVEVVFTYTVY